MNITGLPDREPLRSGPEPHGLPGRQCRCHRDHDWCAWVHSGWAPASISTCRCSRCMPGSIDRRTTSLLGYQYTGEAGYREEPSVLASIPSGSSPCQDGYIQTLVFPQPGSVYWRPWSMPELNDRCPLCRPPGPLAAGKPPGVYGHLSRLAARHTRYEAMAKAQAHRVPLTAVNPPSAVLQTRTFARGAFVDVDHPGRRLPYTREPFRLQGSPADARASRAAPRPAYRPGPAATPRPAPQILAHRRRPRYVGTVAEACNGEAEGP